MKHLLLFILFSGSLDGFSQAKNDTTDLGKGVYMIRYKDSLVGLYRHAKPDTLRATLIVYYDKGPAILHTKPGFVVRQLGKEEVYLDDRLRVVKSPLEVLTYKLKKL